MISIVDYMHVDEESLDKFVVSWFNILGLASNFE